MAEKKRPELTDEFRKKYIKNLKGKEFVEYPGLLALAHQQPDFGHIRAYITQYPCAENKWTTFARAEIYDKNGQIVGMEEADASERNCNKMVGPHAPRMALTRAKGRALRDYLNIDMVTKEELLIYEPDLADPKIIGKIKRMAKAAKISDAKLYTWMEKQTGAEEFNELLQTQAEEFLDWLEKKIQRIEAKRKEKENEDDPAA
jgi:hypothetical protein